MKTLNIIALQQKQVEITKSYTVAEVSTTYPSSEPAPARDQIRELVEVVKLYRRQEQAYFEKTKRKEFAKDELHHMKKTQQKLDSLLSTIQL